ncbi:hypothetical protein V3W47_13090 [Deinococcus sp. YIM 134068]|uniref:hypothetical protein n=1 Tax=Deinococcus lichenicola TaxID=3118910 RepID=UPI002F9243BD
MQILKRSAPAVLLLSGFLTACTETPTPTPTSINGTVSGWSAGAGTVSAQEGTTTLSSAALNANGTFQLALPAASAITPYLFSVENFTYNDSGCSGSLTVSDQNAKVYPVGSLTATAGGSSRTILARTYTQTSTNTQTTITFDGRVWVYADRDVNLSGSVNCTDTVEGVTVTSTLSQNARLHTGWNILKSSAVVTANGATSSGTISLSLTNTSDTASTWTEETASPLSLTKLSIRQTALLKSLEKHNSLLK